MHLPLKLLVAASNELPAKGEGLEALWDRFVIRIESRPIKLEKNFRAMLLEVKSEEQRASEVKSEERGVKNKVRRSKEKRIQMLLLLRSMLNGRSVSIRLA